MTDQTPESSEHVSAIEQTQTDDYGVPAELLSGPSPEDERERLNRAVTVIGTDVPGLVFLTAATAENGLESVKLDYREDLPFPVNPSGEARVSALKSFLEDVQRRPLMLDQATAWGNRDAARITVVRNDVPIDNTVGGARDDLLVLQLAYNPDFVALRTLSDQWLRQEDMSDKLEDLLHVVKEPDQADLLEIVESVRVTKGSVFESGIVRSNGQQTLTYKEDVNASAGRHSDLEVPTEIAFAMPLFDGYLAELYTFRTWFRLRVVNGELMLQIKLKPYRATLRAAWDDVAKAASDGLGIPVYESDQL